MLAWINGTTAARLIGSHVWTVVMCWQTIRLFRSPTRRSKRMVKVTDLQSDRRNIVIPVSIGTDEQGNNITEDLHVTYKPSGYTANMEKKTQEQREGSWRALSALTWVNEIVVAWDLEGTDETGATVPVGLDIATLADLPDSFITEVINGVAKDMGGRQAPSNAS